MLRVELNFGFISENTYGTVTRSCRQAGALTGSGPRVQRLVYGVRFGQNCEFSYGSPFLSFLVVKAQLNGFTMAYYGPGVLFCLKVLKSRLKSVLKSFWRPSIGLYAWLIISWWLSVRRYNSVRYRGPLYRTKSNSKCNSERRVQRTSG